MSKLVIKNKNNPLFAYFTIYINYNDFPVISSFFSYEEARIQAVRDELTKLFNYRFFHEFLDKEIARCKRTDQTCSVIFMDLDFFKVYNDIYGHLAGDSALAKVAEAITESIRATDVAARYGGDEFTIFSAMLT